MFYNSPFTIQQSFIIDGTQPEILRKFLRKAQSFKKTLTLWHRQ